MGKATLPELVFLYQTGVKAEPYTTSEVIAAGTGIGQRKIKDAIRKHQTTLESFGVLASYQAETLNNQEGGRKALGYILNEQQATLLITLLKNTPVVVAFKAELVRQFYALRQELRRRKELRSEGKPIRRALTDALKDSGEVERMKGHAYTAYTTLAYRLTTGKSPSQIRRERGADRKSVAADLLSSEELEHYQKQEAAIAILLDVGMRYEQIKAALLTKN